MRAQNKLQTRRAHFTVVGLGLKPSGPLRNHPTALQVLSWSPTHNVLLVDVHVPSKLLMADEGVSYRQ